MTQKEIFTPDEVKKIFGAMAEKISEENMKFLIMQARFEIERIIKRCLTEKEIAENLYVKTAAKNFLGKYLEAEAGKSSALKTEWMTSFRQGNIQVNFESSESRKALFETEMRKILLPLMKVKIWS